MEMEWFIYLVLKKIIGKWVHHRCCTLRVFVYHVDSIWRTICIIIGGSDGGIAATAATAADVIIVVVVVGTVNGIIVVRVISVNAIGTAICIKTSKEIVAKVALLFNVVVWR